MAITTPLKGTGGISDATINYMLQSGDPNFIKQANEYIAEKEKQAKERGTDKGILGLFGFSKAAAAEPELNPIRLDTPINQFSVTQKPMFEMSPEVNVPGNFDMRGSVVENVVDTPTREFGDMLVGRPDQTIFGSAGQRFNLENNPELFFNTAAGKAEADEEQDFFDYLKNLSGGVVDFGKDILGRQISSQALGGAGGMIFGPMGAIAGGITGLLKGGDMFKPSYDPFYKQFADSGQGGAGFKDKYGINTVSAFGDYGKYALNKAFGINALKGDRGDFYRNVVNKKNAAMTDANVGFVNQDSGSGDSGPSGYEGMSDAASDQERSEGGRGSRG